jgi:hypothetical protein
MSPGRTLDPAIHPARVGARQETPFRADSKNFLALLDSAAKPIKRYGRDLLAGFSLP